MHTHTHTLLILYNATVAPLARYWLRVRLFACDPPCTCWLGLTEQLYSSPCHGSTLDLCPIIIITSTINSSINNSISN